MTIFLIFRTVISGYVRYFIDTNCVCAMYNWSATDFKQQGTLYIHLMHFTSEGLGAALIKNHQIPALVL